MERVTADEAVSRYVRRALAEVGGGYPALVRLVKAELGRDYGSTAARAWAEKGNAPGRVLIAIHRGTGLSLDEVAAVKERPRDLEERLAEVERIIHRLLNDYGELRREVGLPMHQVQDHNEPDQADAPSSFNVVPSQDS